MERILRNTTVAFGLLNYNTAWSRSLLLLSTKFKSQKYDFLTNAKSKI
jgi:hypothetical protein